MRYKEYKATELFWLPEIPLNWEWRFLSQAATEQKIKKPIGETYPVLTLSYGEVKRKKNINEGLVPETYDNYQMLYAGNIVMRLIDLQNDHTSLRTGLVKETGIITSAYTCLQPLDNSAYLRYLLHSYDTKKVFYGFGGGVRQSIGYKDIRNLMIPVPPRAEQDQIVRYLDWQVSKINKLIAAKKKQIAKLQEYEQSAVYDIITGHNDHTTAKKHSGLDWAKELPVNWEVLFLSQVAVEQCMKNTGMVENNLLSLSYGRIIEKDINTSDGLLPLSFEGYQIVYPGNVVLRLTDLQNDHKSLRTGLVTNKGIITSAYTALKAKDNILPAFLRLQLHAADLCKVFYGMGGGVRQSIGYKDIRRMEVFVPPLEEQKRIITDIEKLSNSVIPCIEAIKNEITRFEELKAKLISDVVTGQIDARGIEVPDFEMVEEIDESVDEDDISENTEEQEED